MILKRESRPRRTCGTDTLSASIKIAVPAVKPGPLTSAAAICGLYAVTPDIADTPLLVAKVRAALRGGVRLLQYRNKQASKSLAITQAQALRAVTREASALLIINDDAELALSIKADGVHLGLDDDASRDLAALRREAGRASFIVGISCYNELSRAIDAAAAGADYVALGSFFASATKPGARRAGLGLLLQARQEISVPLVAIGGITLENAPGLIGAGADALAVISALFDAPDIPSQAHAFNQLLRHQHV